MGQITATLKVINFIDRENAKSGLIAQDQVRSMEIPTLVDTGATHLCLPLKMID